MIEILYEDKNLVVCIKPVGLNSQAEEGNSLVTTLNKQLNCEVFPVHRLDKIVSGIIIYAKNSKTAAKLSSQLTTDSFKKEYLAVCDGVIREKEAVLEDLLYFERKMNKTFIAKKMRNGVKEAKLKYELLANNETHSLVKVQLYTGRTHQIRIQFASRGTPLTGDGKYGSKDKKSKCALFAYRLTFTHPYNGKQLVFSHLPVITDYPWNEFQNELENV